MSQGASDFVFAAENDIRATVDMARACFMLLEPGGDLSEQDASAVLRCLGHLEDHAQSLLSAWKVAVAAEQEQAVLRAVA